jgi:alpha-amylase/alpha-mannosidase (GH57 family)
MSGARSVVIHAHLYQPPRENPWTDVVEREPNATPDHDWNARITRECYAPLAAIPVGDGPPASRRTINAYRHASFDVGPTLVHWLERAAPTVLEAMVAGDLDSRSRLGHGNAIAMPYHHAILPLCSRRDKTTEVRWGLADFRRCFGREATGMWLPETAVDDETLDVLAAEGVAFTVLAPHQVERAPIAGLPGRYRTGGGRSIALFAYDGPASHAVAFERLLEDAVKWERALLADPAREVSSIATDGETYGHHHRFGDLALGALLDHLGARRDVSVTNFAAVLARRPPTGSVALVAPSSWSCVHGVERWRTECGCRVAADTQQRWRTPLRTAIDWLVREVHALYERRGAGVFGDVWAARDLAGGASAPAAVDPRGVALIEMERCALAAMTSCGWFFDDFAGLEGRQVLRYAARAIALAGEDAPRLEAGLLPLLKGAVSNDPAAGSAEALYRRIALADRPT